MPRLHEVAASDLELTTIVNPARKLLRRVQLFAGEAEHIDIQGSRLTLSPGFRRHSHTVHYDHLILALGSITMLPLAVFQPERWHPVVFMVCGFLAAVLGPFELVIFHDSGPQR